MKKRYYNLTVVLTCSSDVSKRHRVVIPLEIDFNEDDIWPTIRGHFDTDEILLDIQEELIRIEDL